MLVNIVLIVILLLLIYKYTNIENTSTHNENFDINYRDNDITTHIPINYEGQILPDSSMFKANNIAEHERYYHTCDDDECARIDNHRHKFFEFNDRINHNSHLGDSVDNINITNKACDYDIGMNISDVYDDLVNTNEYKTQFNSLCRNAHDVNTRYINANKK